MSAKGGPKTPSPFVRVQGGVAPIQGITTTGLLEVAEILNKRRRRFISVEEFLRPRPEAERIFPSPRQGA